MEVFVRLLIVWILLQLAGQNVATKDREKYSSSSSLSGIVEWYLPSLHVLVEVQFR